MAELEEFIKVEIADFRRDNLRNLADYLMDLPEDYKHFGMRSYFNPGRDWKDMVTATGRYPLHPNSNQIFKLSGIYEEAMSACGTVACAAGHSPAALGIDLTKSGFSDWPELVDRLLLEDIKQWNWCFSDLWAKTDNTPHGAAERIYTLLYLGLPADSIDQIRKETTYRPSVFDYPKSLDKLIKSQVDFPPFALKKLSALFPDSSDKKVAQDD